MESWTFYTFFPWYFKYTNNRTGNYVLSWISHDDLVRMFYFYNASFNIIDLLTHPPHKLHLAKSRSDAKRLIEQGGVTINDETIEDPNKEIELKDEMLIRVGKRKFIKIVAKNNH